MDKEIEDLKDSEEVLLISLIPDFLISLFLMLGSPAVFVLSFFIPTSFAFKVFAAGIMPFAIVIGVWEFGMLVKIVKKHFS
ncbi:hypothetical protein KJ885_02785 [Patescibacteria group bacterium]|nr:hypothetical protein [Patescibacteria group bacterium]